MQYFLTPSIGVSCQHSCYQTSTDLQIMLSGPSGVLGCRQYPPSFRTNNRVAGRFQTGRDKLRHIRVMHLSAPSNKNTACSVQTAEAWKQKAPYLSPSAGEVFDIQYTASCMCGEVQYAVNSDPVASKYCHCTSCQTLHGMLQLVHQQVSEGRVS